MATERGKVIHLRSRVSHRPVQKIVREQREIARELTAVLGMAIKYATHVQVFGIRDQVQRPIEVCECRQVSAMAA